MGFYDEADQVLRESRQKGAAQEQGKAAAGSRVQLEFLVLPVTDTTIHRVVEDAIPLGRLATLSEFALAIMPSGKPRLKRPATRSKPKTAEILPDNRRRIGDPSLHEAMDF